MRLALIAALCFLECALSLHRANASLTIDRPPWAEVCELLASQNTLKRQIDSLQAQSRMYQSLRDAEKMRFDLIRFFPKNPTGLSEYERRDLIGAWERLVEYEDKMRKAGGEMKMREAFMRDVADALRDTFQSGGANHCRYARL